jgi:NADP-reducing hydrogenase subunit HndB
MNKIKSLTDLQKLKDELSSGAKAKNENGNQKSKVRIKVHMGTSGIASGAKEIYEFFSVELEKRNIDAVVIKTGDMGYCFAEPTIEVKKPGQKPLVFGNVDKLKADEIIEKYIKTGELVEGILPVNYQTIE